MGLLQMRCNKMMSLSRHFLVHKTCLRTTLSIIFNKYIQLYRPANEDSTRGCKTTGMGVYTMDCLVKPCYVPSVLDSSKRSADVRCMQICFRLWVSSGCQKRKTRLLGDNVCFCSCVVQIWDKDRVLYKFPYFVLPDLMEANSEDSLVCHGGYFWWVVKSSGLSQGYFQSNERTTVIYSVGAIFSDMTVGLKRILAINEYIKFMHNADSHWVFHYIYAYCTNILFALRNV